MTVEQQETKINQTLLEMSKIMTDYSLASNKILDEYTEHQKRLFLEFYGKLRESEGRLKDQIRT